MRIFRRNRKDEFDIYLPQHVYHKMLAYAKVTDGEISGWGKTKIRKKAGENVTLVTITDIRIFKQVVSSGHTSLSADALASFYNDLIKDGENPGEWNFWWHSHNDFQVFFSGEDVATIERLSKNARIFSMCINKKGDLVARVDNNARNIAEDIEVRVENPVQDSLMASCRAEVKKKVTVEKFTTPKFNKHTPAFAKPFTGPGHHTAPFTPTHDDWRFIDRDEDRFPTKNRYEWYQRHGIH